MLSETYDWIGTKVEEELDWYVFFFNTKFHIYLSISYDSILQRMKISVFGRYK